jgi:hypothetical protein
MGLWCIHLIAMKMVAVVMETVNQMESAFVTYSTPTLKIAPLIGGTRKRIHIYPK